MSGAEEKQAAGAGRTRRPQRRADGPPRKRQRRSRADEPAPSPSVDDDASSLRDSPRAQEPEQYVRIQARERINGLSVSADGLTASNSKGYRTVRVTHGAREGEWFFELRVNPGASSKSCVRVGWCTDKADLDAPIGFDRHGYSFRSNPPSSFHQRLGAEYGEAFGSGDVIGCLLTLPPQPEEDAVPNTRKLAGSSVRFFKNGRPLGAAFTELFGGLYFAGASLYMGASVTFVLGPHFLCKPDSLPESARAVAALSSVPQPPLLSLEPPGMDDGDETEEKTAAPVAAPRKEEEEEEEVAEVGVEVMAANTTQVKTEGAEEAREVKMERAAASPAPSQPPEAPVSLDAK